MKGYEHIRETTMKTISHSLSQNRRLKAQGATFQAFVDHRRVPPSEIIIERFCGYWQIAVNGHHVPIAKDEMTYFRSGVDPMIVSKALKAKAAGPICVVWNL